MPPKVGKFASTSKAAARPKAAAQQKATATTPMKRKHKNTGLASWVGICLKSRLAAS